MFASLKGNTKIVAALLANGANFELKHNSGKSALDFAKNETIKNLLIAAATTPLPPNAETQFLSNAERIAPLRIVTKGDAVHYFVKLSDWATGAPVLTIFVRAGQTAETDVPLGSYRLKYAAGETWLGVDKLFGEATIYSQADKRFDFAREGNQVSGYTVELILQTGGNLSTRRISKSEW